MTDSSENAFAMVLSSGGDLFDAELESDGEVSSRERRPPPSDYDESDACSLLALKQKRKRRKAKTSRKNAKAPNNRSKKQLELLHSESQRLMRGRPIDLPQYTPKPKSLEDVIAKMSTKSCNKLKSYVAEARELDSGICMDSFSSFQQKTVDSVPKLSDCRDDFFYESPETSIGVHADTMLLSLMKHIKPEKQDRSDANVQNHKHFVLDQSTTPGENRRLLNWRLRESMKVKRARLREQALAARKLDEEEFSVGEDEGEAEITDGDTSMSESGCEDCKSDEQCSNEIVANNRDKPTDCMEKLELSDSEIDDNGTQLFVDQSKDTLPESLERSPSSMLHICKQNDLSKCRKDIHFDCMIDLFDVNGSDNEFDEDSVSEVKKSQVDCRCELTGTRPFGIFSSQMTSKPDACTLPEHDRSAHPVSDFDVAANFSEDKARLVVLKHMYSNASSIDSVGYGVSRRGTPDMFSQPPMLQTGSLIPNYKFSMPIEDSQDLYNDTEMSLLPAQRPLPEEALLQMEDKSCLNDEETCLFDSQGFFKKRTNHGASTWSYPRASSFDTAVSTASNSQDSSNMEELLGLCSGTFSSRTQVEVGNIITSTACEASEPKLFDESAVNADSNDDPMQELIGLCSGNFASRFPAFTNNTNGKCNEAEDEAAIDAGDDNNDIDDDSDEDEDLIPNKNIKKSKPKLPELAKSLQAAQLAQFLENEAELSGSDAVSSDDDDNSDLDEYEADLEADEEIALLTHINLQKQVEKIHHKEMLMQDREDIEAFKDRYLGEDYEEGLDLKTGLFRSKRYVRQFEKGSQTDLFSQPDTSSLPDDGDDSCSQLETKRRRQRFERDNFIKEERLKEKSSFLLENDENSQSILNMIKDENNSNAASSNFQSAKTSLCPAIPKTYNRKMSKHGSFLKRSKHSLNRLSAATTLVPNLNGATRKFVFESVGTDQGNRQCIRSTLSKVDKDFVENHRATVASFCGRKLASSSSVFAELQYSN